MDLQEISFERPSLEHEEFDASWLFTSDQEGTMAAVLDQMWSTESVRLGQVGPGADE